MTAVRLARSTVIVCLFAAAVEVASGCASTAGLAPGDAIVALFVVGPYLLLASLAWRLRARATASRALLAVAVGLSGEGETWLACHRFRLSAGGERLIDATGEAEFARYRCPKSSKR